MSEYWKPLSPRSIIILGRLRQEIHQAQLDIDRASQPPEYKATGNIQIIEGINGAQAGRSDQAETRPATRKPQ